MGRTLILGDLHGSYKALLQVMERCKFDPKKDTLIFIGDLVDGWSEVIACIDYLAKIPNFIFVAGNHDEWAVDYLKTGATPTIWTSQGGMETLKGLQPLSIKRKAEVLKFFEQRIPYYEDKKRAFVHGGFNPYYELKIQDREEMLWDRKMLMRARQIETNKFNYTKKTDPDKYEVKLGEFYDEIYVGHTSTWSWSKVPYHACNVWALDQGAGWYGKLSIMDIDTKEFWQSDQVAELYKEEFGRR